MNAEYHIQVTRDAVGHHFSSAAMDVINRANLEQDEGRNQLRLKRHFNNDLIPEGLAYVDAEHAHIVALASQPDGGPAMQVAFGRLCHTVQDFYSHSNYVDLWLATNGGLESTEPEQIDGLVPALLNHPELRTGHFILWRDFLFHFPRTRRLMRRIWIPPGSHEAMNLDDPSTGPQFPYSLVAARQRTAHEYERAVRAVEDAGGVEAIKRFRGM